MTDLFLEEAAPVCIAGMHRSGTSTVAQLLYRCGLYLGDEKNLLAFGHANPDGHWENKHFIRINEDILRAYDAGWDLPPHLGPDWQRAEELRPQREEAKRLLDKFQGHEPWGWKDPRSSLTLPFWLDLLPDARTVVCLRNPVEVALSLQKRRKSSVAFGLNLWRIYNERLLESLSEGQYVVTHYEAYFHRPQKELRRVLEFLEIPISDQLIALVRSRVIRGLRNHFFTMEDILDLDSSGQVRDLYLRMCAGAEWDPEPVAFPKTLASVDSPE